MINRIFLAALLLSLSFAGRASSDANAEFDELYELAMNQAAGRPIPQVFFQLAQGRASTGGTKFRNMGQLANSLADDFSLYSKVHEELLSDHCITEGKNIAPYLTAFEKEGALDSAVVQKIYARLKINYDGIWIQLKPQAAKGADGIFENFSRVLNVPRAKLCTQLASDPEGSARQLSYPTARASRSQILRAISP